MNVGNGLGVDVRTMLLFVMGSLLIGQVFCGQSIVKDPSDKEAVGGTNVVLECHVADKKGELQWVKDGFAILLANFPRYTMEGDTSAGIYNLKIVNVTIDDDAQFECQLGFADGEQGVSSKQAKLTVLLPPDQPVISHEGLRLEVIAGVPYNLSCVANNGKPAPSFTFLLEGSALTGNTWKETEPVPTKAKLVMAEGCQNYTAVKTDHGKKLKCQAVNPALQSPLEDEVTLEVLYNPEVSMVVSPLKGLRESGEITFKCDSVANPDAVTWKWYRNENIIPGEETNSYKLTNIDRDYHSNTITCEASNKVGPTRKSTPIRMEFGPRFASVLDGSVFKQKPNDVATDIGASAVLKCEVTGNPAPMIVWTKKDSIRVLSNSDTLTIDAVTQEDIGTYQCSATVTGFKEVTAEVNLFLKGPPQIAGEKEKRALQGEDTVIVCTALSIPRPNSMKWYRNGEPLDFTSAVRYSIKEEDTSSGRSSTISIKDVHSNDYGKYNCTVANTYGMDSAVIQLIQIDAVPMAYVIGGVCAGVVLMIIIAIGIFCYHKRKTKESAGGSDTSSELDKKRDNGTKMEYIGREGPLEPWRTDYNRDHYRYSAEYDELKYPDHRPPNGYGPPPADYPDGYNYGPGYTDEYRNGGPPAPGYDNSIYGSQFPSGRSDRSYGPGPQTPVERGYGPAPQQARDRGYSPGPQTPAYRLDNGNDDGGYPQGPQISRLSTNV
nr:Kirrel [Phoronopsis harmeri]